MHVVLDNRYKTVGYDGHAYIDAHCVHCRPPEPLNHEMLFQPLEEKFDLPPVHVQVGDLKSRQVEGNRKEGEVAVLPGIMVSDQSEFRILLEGQLLREDDFSIRENILRKSAPPFHAPVLEVLLCPHGEEGVLLANLEEFRKSIVTSIEHVIRA